jgi:hypothetical protein
MVILELSNIRLLFYHSIMNLGFLVLNSVFIIIYYSIKNKNIINPLGKYIGLGDVLFYIGITLLFSPVNFIMFFIIGLFITLSFYLIRYQAVKSTNRKIPLAGFVSIILIALIGLSQIFGLDLRNDSFFIDLLTNGLY